jgi:hypothetical protein
MVIDVVNIRHDDDEAILRAPEEEAVRELALLEAHRQGDAPQQLPELATRLRHAVDGLQQQQHMAFRDR